MHSPFSQALRDVTGATGQRILRARVAGERAPHPLAALRHDRGQQEEAEIAQALTGTWREAPLVVLKQAPARFDCSTIQRRACEAQLERAFSVMNPRCAPAPEEPLPIKPPPPPRKPHAHSKNAPASHPRAPLLRMPGVDLGAVHGISASIAQTLLSAIGTDMSKWPDEQPVCSWRGLAPKHALAGGKVLRSRPMKTRNRAAHAFRMAAQSVLRAACALGAFDRRVKGRLGPAQALVATAHTIARTVYHMLKERVPSHDIGATEYTKRFRERELQDFQKKAAKLGYKLSLAD